MNNPPDTLPCVKSRVLRAILLLSVILLIPIALDAEEQKDLYEGIIGSYGEKTSLGILPRFKLNPETGLGSGLKVKAANPIGVPVIMEFSNLYTTTRYEQYEGAIITPPSRGNSGGWYTILYTGFDRIPDMRFFGIGNDTRTGSGGNESTLRYRALSSRATAGWSFSSRYFCALHGMYRKVWVNDGIGEDLPQALEKYSGVPGISGGAAPGFGVSLLRSTRDSQWRPREGTRLELTVEETPEFLNRNYRFTLMTTDARACANIFGEYNVAAARIRWSRYFGNADEIPWWSLPQVGGRDSLRGYWDGRFRGRESIQANSEFRFHIRDFSFDAGWFHPRFTIDGNLFADAGRIYMRDDDDKEDDTFLRNWKYSAGAGLRLVTGPNLMGRFDVGFSREQKGAVYFNFGTVF